MHMQCERRDDLMGAATQTAQHSAGVGGISRLAEQRAFRVDADAIGGQHNDGIGRDDQRQFGTEIFRDRSRFLPAEALDIGDKRLMR